MTDLDTITTDELVVELLSRCEGAAIAIVPKNNPGAVGYRYAGGVIHAIGLAEAAAFIWKHEHTHARLDYDGLDPEAPPLDSDDDDG